jgi:hypothetical protein
MKKSWKRTFSKLQKLFILIEGNSKSGLTWFNFNLAKMLHEMSLSRRPLNIKISSSPVASRIFIRQRTLSSEHKQKIRPGYLASRRNSGIRSLSNRYSKKNTLKNKMMKWVLEGCSTIVISTIQKVIKLTTFDDLKVSFLRKKVILYIYIYRERERERENLT